MNKNILLVDDEPDVLLSLQRNLRKEQYNVFLAQSGNEGLAILENTSIDTVISDHCMPGMKGTEFLRHVHKFYPHTTRFMLTGQATLEIAIQAINEGAIRHFFTKPCRSADILARIRLQKENIHLRNKIKHDHNFEGIIGKNGTFKKIFSAIEQVAPTSASVLIFGESGTGKELFARAVHERSNRRKHPLVKVHCAALPTNIIENKLPGSENRIEDFRLANRGTIFLDEICEMSPELQVELLRIVQYPHATEVDVRLIASTGHDLVEAVKTGKFREDLYYRLNVFPIKIPPLRERKEDIPGLVEHFVRKLSARTRKRIDNIPQQVIDALQAYDWPGNVRELENVIERNMILTRGHTLELEKEYIRPLKKVKEYEKLPTLKEAEKNLICKALDQSLWVIGGKYGAASRLGVPVTTLRERIKKYNIERLYDS